MHVLTESNGRAHSHFSLSKRDLATMITHPATSLKDTDLVENLQYKCISKISIKEFSPLTHMLLGDVSDYLMSQR